MSICSPKAVADPNSRLRLHRGINHLDPAQALAYVRARETMGDGSDLWRIKRQQLFMGAVLRQAMSGTLLSNPLRLNGFPDAAPSAVTVDRGTTFGDLHDVANAMHGLDPVAGHVLYHSIVEDAPMTTKTAPTTPAKGRVPAPKPRRCAARLHPVTAYPASRTGRLPAWRPTR